MERPQGFRERSEELERASLSTWAVVSAEAKGRDRHEEPDPLRTAFQVDAHRLLASDAFRALAGKRTWLPTASAPSRLAHTLEVARLTETLARALRLNADLTHAIALGHALGAPPFAEAGEAALRDFGFHQGEHSVRIVQTIERDGRGLNLTWETRDGMLTAAGYGQPATAEGQAVRLCVAIAGVTQHPEAARAVGDRAIRSHLGDDPRAWADRLVADAAGVSLDRPDVHLSDTGQVALKTMRRLVEEVRGSDLAVANEHHRAVHCMQSLAMFALGQGNAAADEATRQGIVDDLAGRTERGVVDAYRARFEPTPHP